MENLEGGSFACVTVVNGVCGAITVAGIFGWIALNNPVGYVVIGACIVNGIDTGMDWW